MLFLLPLSLASCATQSPADESLVTEIDQLIEVVSTKTVELLEADKQSVLAVYYFTVEGEKSGISDYLINGLTTRIATIGASRVRLVTRQALDQILAEHAFQMSDMVNREQQVQIGKQLGADLILTGFITPVTDRFKLNAQLIEVGTGVVRGGFLLDFRLEQDFAERIEVDKARVSEVVKVAEKAVTRTGVATLTTILETFDKGTVDIQLTNFEERQGVRILGGSSKIRIEKVGPFDGSPCLLFSFEGEIDSPDAIVDWRDNYLYYYLDLTTSWKTGDYDGLYLALKPLGFSFIEITLKQLIGEEWAMFAVPLVLNDGEPHELWIPFYDFYPVDEAKRLDPDKPVMVELSIDFTGNYERFHFREGQNISGQLFVDNVGFFEIKGQEDPAVLETFEDELTRLVFLPELYGSSFYVDYTESDEGVAHRTPGVTAQVVEIFRKEGGPSGRYLSLLVRVELEEDFRQFIEDEQSLGFYVKIFAGKSWKGFDSLSFFARSEVLTRASLDLSDWVSEEIPYYYTEFSVSPIWSKISIPFSAFGSDEGNLEETGQAPELPFLSMYFDLFGTLLAEGLAQGYLEVELELDDFMLGDTL